MSVNEIVQKTVDCGAAPLELAYEMVQGFESQKVILRSLLNINSLELGRLAPKQYRVVAGRGKQGADLLTRQIEKVFEAYEELAKRFPTLDCVTVPVLPRTLMEGAATRIFSEFERNAVMPPTYICLEISADVLFEDIESVKQRLKELKDLNVKIAFYDLGDEFCPILRLKELPFDLAFADRYALCSLGDESEAARALAEQVHLYGAKLYAPLIEQDKISAVRLAGYDGYSFELNDERPEDGEEADAYEVQ